MTLSNLDISSLKFLNHKYKVEIKCFRENFNLNDEESQRQYKEMLQRKKMIQEEMETRVMNIYGSMSYQDRKDYFDPETGIVIDRNSKVLYEIAYADEDCSGMVYIMDNESQLKEKEIDDLSDETDYEEYESTDRTDIYRKWDYIKYIKKEQDERGDTKISEE